MSSEGLIHAYLLDGKGGGTMLDWTGVEAWRPNDGILWINLDYSAPDAQDWLRTKSQIEAIAVAALMDPDPRPRAVNHGEDLQLILRGINLNEGAAPEDMVSMRAWIEPRRFVTLRHRQSHVLHTIADSLRANKGPRTAGEFTALLVERVVELITRRVDALSDKVAESEDQVLGDDRPDLRGILADQRRRAIALRRFLAPQREAMTKLAAIAVPWFDASHRARIGEVADDMMRSIEELDAARDRAAVTQEELGSRVAEAANSRLYMLSIITAVFLPLGFVCALLGVNVGGIPFQRDDWAFWALCGVFGVGVGLQLWLFKRRGWL